MQYRVYTLRLIPVLLFISLIMGIQTPVHAQIASASLNLDSAINKAGRQRMLTQRITKAWMLLGQDVAVERAQKQLDSSIALFDTQLEELEDYAPNDLVKHALALVRSQWNDFRLKAIAIPDKQNARDMISAGNLLLSACEKAVKELEALSPDNKGKLINLSGRQRMLSQRIGMLYATHSWGAGNGETELAFKTAVKEFNEALSYLLAAKENSQPIRNALEKVESQWEFSKSGFNLMNTHHFVPYVIQATTESILGKMDAITHQYETL